MKAAHMRSKAGRRPGKAFGNGPHNQNRPIGGWFESRAGRRSRADIPMHMAFAGQLDPGKQPDGARIAAFRSGREKRYRDRFAVGAGANDRRLMRNARKRERAGR